MICLREISSATSSLFLGLILFCAQFVAAQPPSSSAVPKTIFLDSDGNSISNNEFVDIRMANFHYPDKTLMTKLDDGTVEFRLQKIPQEGSAAPEFSVKTIDGKTVSMTDLKGKVVVLTFWFIGCPACLNMEPKLNAFKAKFAGNEDVVFIAMTPDPAATVKKYLAKERFDYLQVADAKDAMESFVFGVYPKNIVIDKNGNIVYWRSTIKAWDKFESVVLAEVVRTRSSSDGAVSQR